MKTTSKTMRGWINGMVSSFSKKKSKKYELIFKEVLNKYNYFHNKNIVPVEIDGWHGKSSFEIIKEIDKLRIIKYQKQNRGSKPLKIVTEASREEIRALTEAIKLLWRGKPIKTSNIAMSYSYNMDLEHSGWKTGDNPFFSDRTMHNKLTLMLGALEKLGLITYEGGYTTLLNNRISVQMVLK